MKKIIVLTLALVLTMGLATGCSNSTKEEAKTTPATAQTETTATTGTSSAPTMTEAATAVSDTLIGKWTSTEGSVYLFNKDGSYELYPNKEDGDKTYFKGKYTFLKGQEAMTDLGLTDEDFAKISDVAKDKNAIYSIKLQQGQYVSKGEDKSSTLQAGSTYWFYAIVPSADTAIFAHINSGAVENMTKSK